MIYDPATEVMKELSRRLASLSYDGTAYPVYSVVPMDTDFDYVAMNPPDLVDESSKDQWMYEATILFDIVTFGGKRGSWEAANSLSGQLQSEVIGQPIVTQSFHSTVDPYIDSVNNMVEENHSGLIMRKLIRIRFNIQQTTN